MKVKNLYDQLGRLESRLSGKGSYPIHKKLLFKDRKFDDLNDWLIAKIDLQKNSSILDAGCGTGKTLFMLADKYGVEGLGISLSPVEIDLANAFKKQNDVKNIDFMVASFDDEISIKLDVIIAIESIKHSNDYVQSIKNLTEHLKPKGEFWLIEDIRISESAKLLKADQFSKWWHVPHIFDQSEIESACDAAKLNMMEIFDLTSEMNQYSLLKAKKREWLWNILLRIVPGKKIRNNIKTFLGGFILDQWYLNNQMAYKVFRLKKPD